VSNKTLTIVICQTREGNFTFSSLKKNLLKPLRSDLAFCGSAINDASDSIIQESKYIWNFPEPEDWDVACDQISPKGSSWRDLCTSEESFLGNPTWRKKKSIGSGFIIMYWREVLRQNLTVEILNNYEWFVITRSDFQWLVCHPSIELLDKDKIYLLDGEKHGGISDRHIIFHRYLAEQILGIASPIFHESEELLTYFTEKRINYINPERFLLMMMERLGLEGRLTFLPYLGFCIRHEGTSSRWSFGKYVEKLDLYLKYPTEYKYASWAKFAIKSDRDWQKILNGKMYFRFAIFRSMQHSFRFYSFVKNQING
jgi:hypothetical protein